jgi:tetratricopeptide (TPR) repeat protein
MDTHPAGKYDTASHHYHKADGTGALCVECHMPESTYMMIDPRRDHSFKIPRPDLSLKYGTPNNCTRCHLDRADIAQDRPHGPLDYQEWIAAARNGDGEVRRALREIDQWSMDWMLKWYGDKWTQQPEYASTFAAAWSDDPNAVRSLTDIARDKQAPAMIRATAVNDLGRFHLDDEARETATRALKDPSPQVRAAALATLEPLVRRISNLVRGLHAPDPLVRAEARRQLGTLPKRSLLKDLKPLLSDPSRLVRTDAARLLMTLPKEEFSTDEEREALGKAFDELVVSLEANSDQSGAHTTLASIYEQAGMWRKAIDCYRKAIYVQGDVVGPRSNLAALLDQLGKQAEAKQLRREELKLLERDVRLLKESGQENAPLLYRLGMSLYLHDRFDEAERALRRAFELEPQTPEFAAALALFCEKFERWDEAISYCRKYLELQPQDRQYQQLLRKLERRAGEE